MRKQIAASRQATRCGLPFSLFRGSSVVWPRADKHHSHCYRCNIVFRDAQLKSGFCGDCLVQEQQENRKIASRSESKVVTKAATKLLSSLKEKGKDGQVMPVLMSTFFTELGGADEVAKIMAKEFKKTLGEGLNEAEEEVYAPNFNLRKDWFDLIARVQSKADVDKQLDVGSLEESDLEAILSNVALKAFNEDSSLQLAVITQAISNAELRRQIFEACIRADSSLATEILQKGGQILDAVSFSKKPELENITAEEDQGAEEDSYDPAADEYREPE